MEPTCHDEKHKAGTLQEILEQLQNNFSSEKQDDTLNEVKTLHSLQWANIGGVTCQFYTQLLQVISEEFCHGTTFKTPIYNSNIAVSGMMKLVGTIIVNRILQGGPGFVVFSPSGFFYLATG